MPDIMLTMQRHALFTDEMRQMLQRDLAEGNDAGVIGVSELYNNEGLTRPSVWYQENGLIKGRSLYGAPLSLVNQASVAYFAAFGHDAIDAHAEEQVEDMCAEKSGNPAYYALCLSFGLIVMGVDAPLDLVLDAQDAKLTTITPEICDMNIRVICDAGLSNHARMAAAVQAETLLNQMIRQALDGRGGDRAKWEPWLGDLRLRVAPA